MVALPDLSVSSLSYWTSNLEPVVVLARDLELSADVFTSCLFSPSQELVERDILTRNSTDLWPIVFVKHVNDEVGEIETVSHAKNLVSCTRDRCSLLLDIYRPWKVCEIALDVRHAPVVEKEAVDDPSVFELGLLDGLSVIDPVLNGAIQFHEPMMTVSVAVAWYDCYRTLEWL